MSLTEGLALRIPVGAASFEMGDIITATITPDDGVTDLSTSNNAASATYGPRSRRWPMRASKALVAIGVTCFAIGCTTSGALEVVGTVYSVGPEDSPELNEGRDHEVDRALMPLPDATIVIKACGGAFHASTGADGMFRTRIPERFRGRDCSQILVDHKDHYGLRDPSITVDKSAGDVLRLTVRLPRTVCPPKRPTASPAAGAAGAGAL